MLPLHQVHAHTLVVQVQKATMHHDQPYELHKTAFAMQVPHHTMVRGLLYMVALIGTVTREWSSGR